jgi:hypothetical protein
MSENPMFQTDDPKLNAEYKKAQQEALVAEKKKIVAQSIWEDLEKAQKDNAEYDAIMAKIRARFADLESNK